MYGIKKPARPVFLRSNSQDYSWGGGGFLAARLSSTTLL